MDTPKSDRQQQFQGYRYEHDPHVQVAANYLAHIQRNFESIFHVVPLTEHQRDILHKVIDSIQAGQFERYENRWPFPVPKNAGAVVTETQALMETTPRVITHEIMDALSKHNASGVFVREYNPKL